MTISKEQLDKFLKGCARPEDLLGEAGLMKERNLRLMERMPGGELTAHLGYEAGAEPPSGQAKRRKGGTTKRVPDAPQPNHTYAAPAAARAAALAPPTRRPTASPPTQAAMVAFDAVLTATASKIA